MEQETGYLKDLRDSNRWIISDDGNLALVSNDAGLRVEAEPVGALDAREAMDQGYRVRTAGYPDNQ